MAHGFEDKISTEGPTSRQSPLPVVALLTHFRGRVSYSDLALKGFVIVLSCHSAVEMQNPDSLWRIYHHECGRKSGASSRISQRDKYHGKSIWEYVEKIVMDK